MSVLKKFSVYLKDQLQEQHIFQKVWTENVAERIRIDSKFLI